MKGPDRWGLFNFREADADAVRAILQPDEISFAGTEMEIPGRIEWWPVILRGKLDAERIQATGLRAYPARSGGLVFAVNWSQGRASYLGPLSHGRGRVELEMVPRAGIEPATPAFSVLCSTD